MIIQKIAANAVHAKLIDPSKEVKLIVSELLSYAVEGTEFMTKRAGWDGRSSFFEYKTGSFPAGFLPRVCTHLRRKNHKVKLIKRPLPEPLGELIPHVDAFGHDDDRYTYQLETVRKLERFGMGIAQVGTGGGKSRISRLAYQRIKRKTLFLTTRGSLMYQFYDSCLESFGADEVGIVGDSEWDSDKPLVCGMVQTLAQRLQNHSADHLIEQHLVRQQDREMKETVALKSKQVKGKVSIGERAKQLSQLRKDQELKRTPDNVLLKQIQVKIKKQAIQRKETIELLKSFEFVIAEEAHEAGGNSYFDVMNACSNANYRLALTATPFMRDDAESNMRLMGCTGGIMIKVSEKQLIDSGILATPKFMILPTERPKSLFKGSSYDKAYKVGIVEHEWRNKRIIAECVRMSRFGLTSMILVQRVNQGNLINAILKKLGLKTQFIKGADDQKARKLALARLDSGEINVLIGTNILDVGVDVPSVGMIALAGGGKAEVAGRQRIGRGLRAKKKGPNICFVLDFMDEHNSHLQKHAIQRRAIITQTPGFAENLLPTGEVWNPTKYGFERVVKK